jgi:FkbM family methyltransferase
MFFSLLLRGSGKVIVVEPDCESIREFRLIGKRQGIQNVILCPVAAWSTRGTGRLFVNDSHPASSFTEGTKEYDAKRLKALRLVEMPADSIDNILNEIGTNTPDLISITTNGAETQILQGMRKTIASGLPYISLAATGPNYTNLMKGLGYSFLTDDDRCYTFEQERIVT